MKSKYFLERLGIRYSVRLNEGINTVGRAYYSTVQISGTYASRNHCNIVVEGDKISLEDFSSNGTFVNEEEFKGTVTTLKENDKIGIGVYSVDDELEVVEAYHVFKIYKITSTATPTNNVSQENEKNLIIEISDGEESSVEELNFSCAHKQSTMESNSNGIKQENDSKKFKTNAIKEKLKWSVSSDKERVKNRESNTGTSDKELFGYDQPSTSKQNEINNGLSREINAVLINKQNREGCHQLAQTSICGLNSKTNIGGVVPTLLNKSKPEKNEKFSTIKSEIDYDFSDELSQAVWGEIKQEIAELELDFTELQSDDLNRNKNNNLPVVDTLDLTLDVDALNNEEDDEMDITTRQWYMKLSQNFDESVDKKSKVDTTNSDLTDRENQSEFKDEERNLRKDARENESDFKVKGKNLRKDVAQQISPRDTNSNSKNCNIQIKTLDNNLTKSDNRFLETNKRKKNPFLIDAPSLPTKRGKYRAVSADSNSTSKITVKSNKSPVKSVKSPKTNTVKSPRKSLRTYYSSGEDQTLKLQKKWLEKPNSNKEKNKTKQIKDKRKEKLKELAEKNYSKGKLNDLDVLKTTTEKRKHSISLDNLEEDERDKALKKAKVKITDKNRGAFLTELSSIPIAKIPNRRKSIDASLSPENRVTDVVVCVDKISKPTIELNKKNGENNKRANLKMSSKEINSCVTTKQKNLNFNTILLNKKSNGDVILKSCLKSPIIRKSKDKYKKKTVKFLSSPFVYFYDNEPEFQQSVDQSVKQINNKNIMQPDLSYFEGRKRIWQLKCPQNSINIIDDILSEILSWKPDWFDNVERANINGSKVMCPMIHSFKTFEDYQKIVFPLMKLELWERLIKDKKTHQSKFIQLNLKKFEVEDKVPIKRIIYSCEYSSSSPLSKPLFYSNELVFIKILNNENIFGHVRINRCLNPTSSAISKPYSIKIESNFYPNMLTELRNIKVISLQKISVIATELGAFEAVKNLEFSPLLKKILNPYILVQSDECIPEEQLKRYKYNGYDKLNETQEHILMQTYLRTINPLKDNITLIEGPPGTGKSRLVTNLILQLQYGLELRQLDRKILVCAQSNVAVDVITQKLIRIRQKMDSKKFRLVRYGVLDKMHPDVRPYSLTELIRLQKRSTKSDPNTAGLLEEKQLLEEKINRLETTSNSNSRDGSDLEKAKKDLNQINSLLKDHFSEIDRKLEYKFLANANIVCTTLSSCVKLLRYCNFFDVCIIDEATQCNEPWTLVPLQFGINSLILIGDTQQLPATTLSHLSKSYNFGKSYFTRAKEIMENRNQSVIMSLKIQYRMHPEICQWPNSYFYRKSLINDETTTNFKPLIRPYTMIELNFNQNKMANGIENCLEADFVVKLVQGLVDMMPTRQFSYAIITPYNLHCLNLREKLRKEKLEIEVNTIDSYQGKEKDVIIISNARTEGVGFLNEICRLNVAITRAKKCLLLCGNFQHLTNLNVWKSLLSDAKRRNLYLEPKEGDLKDFKKNVLGRLKL